ncbi:glycosyl hydrolase 108 family protein [Chryseobacterium sp. KACC 21268]|nr:glycosyl hydrolase 108 family protein [Chryseobacterium sp. KACC 21268]
MADFKIAYKKTNANEGGWNHVKGDTGGETYCGIARNHWPDWKGWPIVDAFKKKNGIKHGQKINDPELERLKMEFYKTKFWDVVGGDKTEDQNTADTLYDFGVNSGQSRSIQNIQEVLGLPKTGKITSELIKAINNPTSYLL